MLKFFGMLLGSSFLTIIITSIFITIDWICKYRTHKLTKRDLKVNPTVTMDFESFYKIFCININRWTLNVDYPNLYIFPNIKEKNLYKYFLEEPCQLGYIGDKQIYGQDIVYQVIMSNYIEFRKFARWLKKYSKSKDELAKQKRLIVDQDNLNEMLNTVKRDIKTLENKANKEINEAREIINGII